MDPISCIGFLILWLNLTLFRRVVFQLQFGVLHLIYVAPKMLDAAPVRDEAYNEYMEYGGENIYHEGKV